MNHYYINGQAYVIIEGKLYQEVPHNEVRVSQQETAAQVITPKALTQRRQARCSVCQKPGHTAKTCPKNRPENYSYAEPKKAQGIDEATIRRIKDLYTQGKSMKEIKEETGVSYPTIGKYTALEHKQRKQRDREEDNDGLDEEEDGERPTFGGNRQRDEDWNDEGE
jgi:hypothetical protein